ncbi:PAAR domain-containing protein [Burkholderia pyrrocinia]|uniref:PAAR domain-containing protein n=1 Tax=Burkholderia pyrrocinia TaxID=60550 RepID=UPI002AB2B2D8|nr:PAAR domain-containing protein [Burkholderia pyrrocinia]
MAQLAPRFFYGHRQQPSQQNAICLHRLFATAQTAALLLLVSIDVYPIVQGSSQYMIEGRAVALDGMKTACGASLIASQQEFMASE